MSMAQGSIAITHAVSREGGEGHTARRRSFKDRRVAKRAQTSRMRRDASQKRRSPGTRGETPPTPELSPAARAPGEGREMNPSDLADRRVARCEKNPKKGRNPPGSLVKKTPKKAE